MNDLLHGMTGYPVAFPDISVQVTHNKSIIEMKIKEQERSEMKRKGM